MRLLVVLCVAIGGLGMRNAAADKPDNLKYDRWVKQLGDNSFLVRQEAAKRLMTSGPAAASALTRGLKDPDLEVRMEAHRLLIYVLQADFEGVLKAFVEEAGKDKDYQLSGWKAFRKTMGDTRATRQLFADMVRAESRLLDAVARREFADPLGDVLIRRLQELADARLPNGARAPASLSSLAALLFVASRPDAPHNMDIESRLSSILNQSTTKQAVLMGSRSKLLKRLLSLWVEQQIDHSQTYYFVPRIILAFNLKKVGLKMGRKTLENPKAIPTLIPYAAIAIVKFGSRKDVRYLLPHLKNTTVCHTWHNPQLKKEPIRIEVRDVVLAMLILMTGQEPKDYGFKLLSRDPDTIYRIHTFGFLEDEQREQALKKWRQWYAAHRAEWDEGSKQADKSDK